MRRALVLAGFATVALLVARNAGALGAPGGIEGDVSRRFDPFGALLAAEFSIENALYFAVGTRLDLSPAGLAEIQRHEGLRLAPYQDAAGFWTIGYGHLMGALEPREPITAERAAELLAGDVAQAVNAVNALVTVPLTQSQFDALVSFVFNVGAGNFRGSTLLRVLNAGDYGAAAAEFSRWINAGGRALPGLIARRGDEARLFSGVA